MSLFQTLICRTDALVEARESLFEDRGSYVIQRTPDQPDYWSGNGIISRDRAPLDEQRARFAAAFPEATHVSITWDIPDLTPYAAAPEGFDWEEDDVLALEGPVRPAPAPAGIELRRIESAEDWSAVSALQTATGVEEGHPEEPHAAFNERRFARIRADAESGHGAWFGAFDGEMLVADMGLVIGDGLARFRNVETRASHRRRGICAALLSQVTAGIGTGITPVIVAERDGAAGRLYRRAGFRLAERGLTLQKRGY